MKNIKLDSNLDISGKPTSGGGEILRVYTLINTKIPLKTESGENALYKVVVASDLPFAVEDIKYFKVYANCNGSLITYNIDINENAPKYDNFYFGSGTTFAYDDLLNNTEVATYIDGCKISIGDFIMIDHCVCGFIDSAHKYNSRDYASYYIYKIECIF